MTKSDLKKYIKTRLGYPVINIEIADEQLDVIIMDTLAQFREYHIDALKQQWIYLDVGVGVQEYDLPENIFAIKEIYGRNTRSLFSYDNEDQGYMMKSAFVGNHGLFGDSYNATDIEVIRQRYNLYQAEIKRDYVFDFSYLEHKLKLMIDLQTNERIVLLCECFMDNEDSNYSSLWFRNYCVALSGLAWAANIGKYDSISLPGGGSFNHRDIFNKYNDMKTKLDQDMLERYSTTYFFEVG